MFRFLKKKDKKEIKTVPNRASTKNPCEKPINKRSKKPSPIHKKQVEYKNSCIIKSGKNDLLKINIPSTSKSYDSDEDPTYTRSEIGYDYNKDRTYKWELTSENAIHKLFDGLDLSEPIILRGNWKKIDHFKYGWMVPCYFCWCLTSRKIGYQNKHMVYACKECLPPKYLG